MVIKQRENFGKTTKLANFISKLIKTIKKGIFAREKTAFSGNSVKKFFHIIFKGTCSWKTALQTKEQKIVETRRTSHFSPTLKNRKNIHNEKL